MSPKTLSVTKSTLCILSFLTLISAANVQNQDNRSAIIDVPSSNVAIAHGLICIGQGVDSTALGMVASIIVLLVIGCSLWLTFAFIRPKFRELYAVREWFPPPESRARPLSKSFWAFLSLPLHVPPGRDDPDASDAVPNNANSDSDLAQFPSDERLAQRTLWHTFVLVCFWSIVGLGGALPAYLVRTPCVAHVLGNDILGGRFSTMQDLSLFRLLVLLDHDVPTAPNIRTRIIIVGALAVAVVVISASIFLYEFNRIVIYRRRWLDIRCGGVEMAWLSLADARGFAGWNENALKDYLVKIGLSQGFKDDGANQSNTMASDFVLGERPLRRKDLEIDVQNLFSIVETSHLSQLIQERDIILNNLEVAEVQYINSFQLSTPFPSITDYEAPTLPPLGTSDLKRHISRPKALRGSIRRHTPHERHPHALGSTPTTYLAPSSFYKLRDIRTSQLLPQKGDDNFATRVSQRIIGTRFQEAQRGTHILSRVFSWGSESRFENIAGLGSMNPAHFSAEQLRHGPHEPLSGNIAKDEVLLQDEPESDDRWLKPVTEENQEYNIVPSPTRDSIECISEPRPRPRRERDRTSFDRRSTFAMRLRSNHFAPDTDPVPPPHLRLQSQRPFVRPVSGMDHEQLGIIYNNIREWRSRLKLINGEIAEAQQSCYDLIASGNGIKGWLLVGRGLRHLPHIQMIEGRSKDDILYEQLEVDIGSLGRIVFWCVICVIILVSCGIMIPVSGLIVSLSPGVAHYLRVLRRLNDIPIIGAGLITTLAPALFILLLLWFTLPIIRFTSRTTGVVSASMANIRGFQASFIVLNATYCFWLLACGSIIFSLESFANGMRKTRAIADGLLYTVPIVAILTFALTVMFPALWIIQPRRLNQILKRKKFILTPRQRFRNLYPSRYDENFVLVCCYLPVTFAAAFCIISPVVGPPVCLLLLVANMAHKYLIGYVYIEGPQTGGLLQLWLLQRLANLTILQPLVLGLIILTRRLWVTGGVLIGISILLLSSMEFYTRLRLRLIQPDTLSDITKEMLYRFRRGAQAEANQYPYTEGSSIPGVSAPPRSSVASVLEMMSITLAVIPPGVKKRGPIPLYSEAIDDLTATETAARTNPDAPPRLPPLAFMTHTEEMHSILYTPELLAPPPVIWLPNDFSGVAETEAIDLFRYHDLQTTLDISASELQ